ncbi:DsrE family protein (plasmid) [Halorussus limi]|uniref:DsrE family protein n=1 Tax=Halorussus limi TaxID=2938695 RepID=A0A8U0I0B0_9EURY|nr:DsrE family protein [Halorussus limi]UPV76351.1 DsrE family protein [Halorussus limi]
MRTAFHLTSGDEDQQKTVLTIAENLSNDETIEMDDIVVVAQSKGIDPLTVGGTHSGTVESLMTEGIEFRACSNTLDMMDIEDGDLVEGVEKVSSGASELTRLQDDGYAYLRP